MQIGSHTGNPATHDTDLLAIGVFAGGLKGNALIKTIDKALGGSLLTAAKEQSFTGKSGQCLPMHTLGKTRATRIALLGMGEAATVSNETLVEFGGRVARAANQVSAKKVLLVPPKLDDTKAMFSGVARGLELGCYRYNQYRKDPHPKPTLAQVTIHVDSKPAGNAGVTAAKRAQTIASGVALARDLVNESPLQLYPETFAKRAATVARASGLKCKILKPDQLKRLKMNLHLGVGAGSSRAPRLVHLTYEPKAGKSAASSKKPVVLVGKGITFDSGGLSLKPPAGMVDMKMDMGGAAAVLGTMQAIAKLKPKVAVHGLMVLAENMPSSTAIRPGDVITGASGKSVEINNTDAEGRLVLADGLHYATQLKPARIIDIATLTGACVVALGGHTVGVFANDDKLADAILSSAKATGESFWRMPLTESLKSQLESDVADLRNTGERWGGAITAGLFLQEFIGKTPWAHLDIAGPAMTSKDVGAQTKGGTGVAVATLVDLIAPG